MKNIGASSAPLWDNPLMYRQPVMQPAVSTNGITYKKGTVTFLSKEFCCGAGLEPWMYNVEATPRFSLRWAVPSSIQIFRTDVMPSKLIN